MGPLSPRCHLLAPLILVLCRVHLSGAFIYAYLERNASEPRVFEDLPALFGPILPLDGLRGYVIPAEPKNGCTLLTPPPKGDNSTLFIALIRRYDCNFDIKVLNAQLSGFGAVIVHNVDSDKLLNMAWNDDHTRSQIAIPSVFTGERAGRMLMENFSYYDHAHVLLFPEYYSYLGYYLLPFFVVVAIIIIVMCAAMIVRCVQHRKKLRRNRLSKDQLKKIPVHKFKKGDEYDMCAICLEEYEDGDKLRVLPCSHAYHCGCVDPWLTKTKKSCPVCKHRVLRTDDDSDSEAGDADDERTPLLRPSPSFGSMAESPQSVQPEEEAPAPSMAIVV